MAKSYKEQLSEHVEAIFKEHVTPGLHICDIATGGGKLTVSANRYQKDVKFCSCKMITTYLCRRLLKSV